MKTLFFSVVVLIAPVVANAGVNLNWTNCYPSAPTAVNQSFSCDDSSPGAMDANTQTFLLYASVIAHQQITGVVAWGATVELQISTPGLDDWWSLGAGGCREGAITFTFNGFTNTTSCNKSLMATAQATAIANWAPTVPGHVTYSLGVARTTPTTVQAEVEYQLAQIAIDTHNTALNGDGTTVACGGCLSPATLVLSQVEIDVPPSERPPDGRTIVNVPENRSAVTWQVLPAGNSVTTEVKRWTIGRIRAMYR